MKNTLYIALIATSVAFIPIIFHQKVLGKSGFIVSNNNHKNISISKPLAFGYIQTRNRRIAINSNQTYTIYNKDGKVVTENINLEQLQARNPELYEIVKDAIAGRSLMMDAGINSNNLRK